MTTIVFRTPYGKFSLAERPNPKQDGQSLAEHVKAHNPLTALDAAETLEAFTLQARNSERIMAHDTIDRVVDSLILMPKRTMISYVIVA